MLLNIKHPHDIILVDIVSTVIGVIRKISVLLCDNSKTSGRFVLIQNEGIKATIISTKIGVVPEKKNEKYQQLSLESAKRLQLHPEHWTSYESRKPKEWTVPDESQDSERYEIKPWGQWGGAVRGEDLIFSFSGFPELSEEEAELWSEAAMFVAAIILKQLDKEEVLSKINEERNPFLRPSLKVCV